MADDTYSMRQGQGEGDRGRRRWLVWLAGGTAGLAIVLGVLWTQRAPIAENFIARELNARGARARYDLVAVGLRTQRIEHLVLGNPANPDLTADWVEIDLTFASISPSVAAVRAGGVRMRGRLHDGVLSLGELDKFRGTDSREPFSLPDLKLGLSDARMRLDTDAGAIGLKLDGGGNARTGFAGKLAAVMPRAVVAGCVGDNLTAYVDVTTRNAEPRFVGPVRSMRLDCPGTAQLSKADMAMDIVLGARLDSWRGRATGRADGMRMDIAQLVQPNVKLQFRGDKQRTEGTMSLGVVRLAAQEASAGKVAVESRFALVGSAIQADGTVTARDVRLAARDPLAGLRVSMRATPLAALATKLADAVRGAGGANTINTRFSLRQAGGKGDVLLSDARLASASGARVTLARGSQLKLGWPGGLSVLDGRLAMEGGGLPRAVLALSRQRSDKGWAGQLFLEDYRAGPSRLAAPDIRFVAGDKGITRFSGNVELDGPLPDGFVRGLTMKLSGTLGAGGALKINPACTPVTFAELAYATLKLGATRLSLCPVEGGALLAWDARGLTGGAEAGDLRLHGAIGSTPLTLNADRARFALSSSGFSAAGLEAIIGQAESPVRLKFATLDGAIRAGGLSGTMRGGTGRIGAVPLIMSEADGDWRYADGLLGVDGALAIADTVTPVRFKRLTAKDLVLSLRDARIRATGTLNEPRTGAAVAKATIAHDLNSGIGSADLDVSGLTFNDDLQPADITPLTLGVVAEVRGTMNGTGHIRWTPNGVASDGVFSTRGTNLAAAFGPVEGLSGNIVFSDLLGLVTPPHQEMTIASINPGIPVTDGTIRYQLLADQTVQIEGGTWPFAGGRLVLEPTLLDLGTQRPRNLTFQVQSLDAAQFLQQFGFENINATGIFDGVLPMIFDAEGGRIVGGRLTARAEGGSLAYIGQLSQEDLGYWGNYAFQMLKAVNYRTLGIEMNGDLAGEMVTGIAFTGLSQGQGTKTNFIVRRIAKLPIRFNVTIRAPFRQLLFSAKSFYDPGLLIQQNLPALIQAQEDAERQAAKPIQQQESEKKP